jgi:hypothetical protein
MSEANSMDCRVGRVLHLTLKRQWFDMIASGVKREEYREIKPYWNKRLLAGRYDVVHFRNGYNPDSPLMVVELVGTSVGLGYLGWGAPLNQHVHILHLGRVLRLLNTN